MLQFILRDVWIHDRFLPMRYALEKIVILLVHMQSARKRRNKTRTRRSGIFRDIEKHFRDPVLEKRLGARRARPIAEREGKKEKTRVDISFSIDFHRHPRARYTISTYEYVIQI